MLLYFRGLDHLPPSVTYYKIIIKDTTAESLCLATTFPIEEDQETGRGTASIFNLNQEKRGKLPNLNIYIQQSEGVTTCLFSNPEEKIQIGVGGYKKLQPVAD